MARFTASKAFNIDNFDLSTFFADATKVYDPTNFSVGTKVFDGRLIATDSVAPRAQMIAFLEDETTALVDNETVFTGGTVGLLRFDVGFGTTGWTPAFRISSIDANVVDLVNALSTATADDDRAFLAGLFSGNDTMNLSVFNDKINAGGGNDRVNGSGGNDTLLGGDGADTLDGALGNDNLQGNLGNDLLMGNRGADVVNGGLGADIIRGGLGMDTLIGGADSDIFDFRRTDGHDIIADYNDVEDIIRVDVLNPALPGMIKEQDGAHVKVTFAGVAGFSITILNEDVANIWNNDFSYV